MNDLLNNEYVRWMDVQEGPDSDIVVSSRIRLARNLQGQPFPHLLESESGSAVLNAIRNAFTASSNENLHNMKFMQFDQLSPLDRQILLEKHLISPEHAACDQFYRGLVVNSDGSQSIMINEEDHLRIQCLLPGLQTEECYRLSQEMDDELEKHLDFAFDEHRGYLTSCPTNVGTGMRASVMLHLPAVSITGQRSRIFHNISQLGMTVRGMYGEGTEMSGNLIQLSNQITLGQTEEEIISNLKFIAKQIVEQERVLRENLMNEIRYQLEDRVGRAYGILTNAVVITSNEALSLLSDVRLGVDLGIIRDITPYAVNQLIVAIKPAHLQKKAGMDMEAFSRDIKRAEVIKHILSTDNQKSSE